jgi:hypothetical protein
MQEQLDAHFRGEDLSPLEAPEIVEVLMDGVLWDGHFDLGEAYHSVLEEYFAFPPVATPERIEAAPPVQESGSARWLTLLLQPVQNVLYPPSALMVDCFPLAFLLLLPHEPACYLGQLPQSGGQLRPSSRIRSFPAHGRLPRTWPFALGQQVTLQL